MKDTSFLLGYLNKEASKPGIKELLITALGKGNALADSSAKAARKAGNFAADNASVAGAIIGGGHYAGTEGEMPLTSGGLALMAPWLARRVRMRYRDAVKETGGGLGPTSSHMMEKMLPELGVKGGATAGLAALDVGMKEGPEVWNEMKGGIKSFNEAGANATDITENVAKTTGSLADVSKGMASDLKGATGNLSNAAGSLDKTLKSVGKFGDSVKKVADSPILQLGSDKQLGALKSFLSDNKHKLLAGAGGAAGLYGIYKYIQYKKEKQKEEEDKKRHSELLTALANR